MYVHTIFRLGWLSGHHLGKSCSLGRSPYILLVLCVFVIKNVAKSLFYNFEKYAKNVKCAKFS